MLMENPCSEEETNDTGEQGLTKVAKKGKGIKGGNQIGTEGPKWEAALVQPIEAKTSSC